MGIAKAKANEVLKFQDLDDLLETGEIINGEIEIFEGIVKWTKRKIQYTRHDIEIVENYEFVNINRDNIDIDNPPDYLENYLEYIFNLELLTVKESN